jgi:hypothetical protein
MSMPGLGVPMISRFSAQALHDAGVGIIDVAVIGAGMKNALETFAARLAEPLRAIGT